MDSFSPSQVPSPAHMPHGKITFSVMLQWAVILILSMVILCFLYSLVYNLWYHGNNKEGCNNITQKHEKDARARDTAAYNNHTLTDSHGYKKILEEIKVDWNTYARKVNTFIRIITCGRVQQALYLYPGVMARRFFHCKCCEVSSNQDLGHGLVKNSPKDQEYGALDNGNDSGIN